MCPGLREPVQEPSVQFGQQPLHSRVGCDWPEQLRLIPQRREIGNGLTAVSEHHRQVHRDPPRVMPTPALPQHSQGLTEPGGQPGHLGHISDEPSTGMADHTTPVGTHNDLRARSGSLYSAGAFVTDDQAFDKPDPPRWRAPSLFLDHEARPLL
jgi:hypothetical protein